MTQNETPLTLTFIAKDPNSGQGECAALYRTNRGTFGVQGKVLTDPAVLAQLRDLAPDETVVEIPAELVRFFPQP